MEELPTVTQPDKETPQRTNILTVAVVSAVIAGFVGGAAGLYAGTKASESTKVATPVTSPAAGKPETRIIREESSVIDVVNNVSPAVVSIIVTRDIAHGAPFDDPLLRQYFGEGFSPGGTEEQEVGGGTGFIVTTDGLILTNKHVVNDTDVDYSVLTNKGKRYPAKVLARDPTNDLAILKIDQKGLPTVKLGTSSSVQIGQKVVAIGNALGEFRNTVSTGVISGLSRSITAGSQGQAGEQLRDVLQTDAAINPGNSGGPLLDMDGRVIGINTAIVSGAQNIGFALPVDEAKADIESVRKHGKIIRPVLGIRYIPVNKALQLQGNLDSDRGAYIPAGADGQPSVEPDGPAGKAGLRERDIIIEVNGEEVNEEHPLPRLIQKFQIGNKVNLTVLRGKKRLTLTVTLGKASF